MFHGYGNQRPSDHSHLLYLICSLLQGPSIEQTTSVRLTERKQEAETTSDRVFGSRIEVFKPSIRLKTQMDIRPGE